MPSRTEYKRLVGEERQRCWKLVNQYRLQIEGIKANPRYDADKSRLTLAEIAEKVARSLKDIEDNIRDPNMEGPRGTGSDFSLDELARAEALIAEQSKNPFEEDVS